MNSYEYVGLVYVQQKFVYTLSGKRAHSCYLDRFDGYFIVGGGSTWCQRCHFEYKWNPESSWHLDNPTWAIWRHVMSVMSSAIFMFECAASVRFSHSASGGILLQHKTLDGLCGFANVSQASTGIAKSGWTVPLNNSLGHKKTAFFDDVWCVSSLNFSLFRNAVTGRNESP